MVSWACFASVSRSVYFRVCELGFPSCAQFFPECGSGVGWLCLVGALSLSGSLCDFRHLWRSYDCTWDVCVVVAVRLLRGSVVLGDRRCLLYCTGWFSGMFVARFSSVIIIVRMWFLLLPVSGVRWLWIGRRCLYTPFSIALLSPLHHSWVLHPILRFSIRVRRFLCGS